MNKQYFKYWGKAKKDPLSDGPDYHLLVYHCMDVAAVGYYLLDPSKTLCQRLSKTLNVKPDWLRDFFTFNLILHDLGKFARAFQNLVPNLSGELVPCAPQCLYDVRHDSLGFGLWDRSIKKRTQDIFQQESISPLTDWLEITFGHHGQPIDKSKARHAVKSHFLTEDESAAEEFVRDITNIWQPCLSTLTEIDPKTFKMMAWQLAGLSILSDWLGSNQSIFTYQTEPQPLADYWTIKALPNAKNAISTAAFNPIKANPFNSIQQQFDFITKPTPLQTHAQYLELAPGPQLFILEDVTGAGKTEAAMVLVHRLMSERNLAGVYVGLPTMATANAMYERLSKSYRQLYAPESLPSLVLSHGARQLSSAFQESVKLSEQSDDKQYQTNDLTASAYCNQWLADSRKKALLADVGVGTIDQALLGILPARHQSLRLLGLADKVLLVDEVHAFDPYMQSLLSALLQAHAAQGGSAILLSATLPQHHRLQLLHAYARGLNIAPPQPQESNTYPLSTHLSATHFSETAIETREEVRRSVIVERLDSEQSAVATIQTAIQQGQCVCWIRNTVADAQNSYEFLLQQDWLTPENVTLFHSRYAMIDRQAIEMDVLSRFGKTSGPSQRTGQVLIATQVVEQSLDLDFDVMISDLAPIDLIIQRAGRLQRHVRNVHGNVIQQGKDGRPMPCFYIVSPDPENVRDRNWLKSLLPGTQTVYRHVGQLWLTMKALLQNKGFSMPDDARNLIEFVYGGHHEIPEVLELASLDAEAERKAQQGMGDFNCLDLDKGYTWQSAAKNGGWGEDINIPTRLGNDSVDVVLALPDGEHLTPYADATHHAWELSRLSVPRKDWERVKASAPEEFLLAVDNLKSKHPSLAWSNFLVLNQSSTPYSQNIGWQIEDPAKAGNE